MRIELTTFSLARRRSTAELRPQGETTAQGQIIPLPHTFCKVDPVGFEPTISSVQRRRLPARPRARASDRAEVPTRGLRTSTPKGQQILSLQRLPIPPRRQQWTVLRQAGSYSRFCLNRHLSLRLAPEAAPGLPGVTWHHRRRCDETELLAQPSPLALLPVARSPSRRHCCHRWWALTGPEGPLACAKPPFQS